MSYNYGSKNYDRVMQTSKTLLRFQFLFFVPMFMKNKVLAVVLSAPISDVFSVVVTVACFVP